MDLHLALRLDLLAPQALADGSRLGPQRHIERIGEAVRRVRREDDGSQAGGRTAAGRGGGDAGLADAALARVKDDSGRLHERLRLSAGRGSEAEPFRPILYPARLTEVRDQGDFHLTRIRTTVAVLAIALPVIAIVAGCGGGSSSSSEDPQQVLDQTFNNPTKITSGKLDLSIDGSAEGQQSGNFSATITGPFQTDPSNTTAFPQLDLAVSVSGSQGGPSISFDGSLIATKDNAYVEYQNQAYELGTAAFQQFATAYAKAAKQNQANGSSSGFSQFGIDPKTWLTNVSNEGTTDIDGTNTIHIHGDADVSRS